MDRPQFSRLAIMIAQRWSARSTNYGSYPLGSVLESAGDGHFYHQSYKYRLVGMDLYVSPYCISLDIILCSQHRYTHLNDIIFSFVSYLTVHFWVTISNKQVFNKYNSF